MSKSIPVFVPPRFRSTLNNAMFKHIDNDYETGRVAGDVSPRMLVLNGALYTHGFSTYVAIVNSTIELRPHIMEDESGVVRMAVQKADIRKSEILDFLHTLEEQGREILTRNQNGKGGIE
jgi:hypothetical protein